MTTVSNLISLVETARANYLNEVDTITQDHEHWKQGPATWSITDVTEHLVWAEQGGILMMWKALQAHQQGQDWQGERVNKALAIEDIVARTWRYENGEPKEVAPASAVPRLGGPLAFWRSSLLACHPLLKSLGEKLQEVPEHELEDIIYPHVIMGPLNVVQRLEFLRFHLEHHQQQLKRIQKLRRETSSSDTLQVTS